MRKSNLLFTLALVCAALLSSSFLSAAETLHYADMDPYDYIKYNYYPKEIYGNLKLDSMVWKDSNGAIYYIEFDAKGNVTKVDDDSFEDGTHFQIFYSYDADGNCTALVKMINQYSGQWDEVQKAEFTCDAKGRTTRIINSVLSAGTWKLVSKYETTYDAHDNVTNSTKYEYQEDLKAWKSTYMSKRDYTYNANGKITKYVYSLWDTSDGWVNNFMEEYEYDNKGRETLKTESRWRNSSWVNNWKTTTGYSDPSDGIIYVLINTEKWNTSTNKWDGNMLEGYQYYENGPWYYYTKSYYKNSSWTPYLVKNRTYDSDGKLLSEKDEYKEGNEIDLNEYMYDDDGNKIARIYSELKSGSTTYTSTTRWYFSADTEGIDEVFTDRPAQPAHKVLRDGMLLIERNGKTYNAQGAELR